MSRIAIFASFFLVFATSVLAQDKAMIQKLNDDWCSAFKKGDAAAVAGMYAEDAYVLPPGADMVKGRAAIETFWRQEAQHLSCEKLTTVDVLPLGSEAAHEIGTFILRTKGQPPQEVLGKYATVWRKIGGQWKLKTDIWNSNK